MCILYAKVWPHGESQRYAYSISVMVLQYFLPLIILAFTYVNIAVVIWTKRVPGEAQNSRDQKLTASKRKVRTHTHVYAQARTEAGNTDTVNTVIAHNRPMGERTKAPSDKSPPGQNPPSLPKIATQDRSPVGQWGMGRSPHLI